MHHFKSFHLLRFCIMLFCLSGFLFVNSGNVMIAQIAGHRVLLSLINSVILGVLIFLFIDFVSGTVQSSALRRLVVDIINNDSTITRSFSLDKRKEFTRAWLATIYSDQNQKRALNAVADRYIAEDKWRYRISKGLRADIAKLDVPAVEPSGLSISFKRESYFRHTDRSSFSLPMFDRVFERSRPLQVVVALSDLQLAAAYESSQCIFRNLMVLEPADQAQLLSQLGEGGSHNIDFREVYSRYYCLMDGLIYSSLSLTHKNHIYKSAMKSARYETSLGIVMEFEIQKIDRSLISDDDLPVFDVTLAFIQSRKRTWLAESYNEPSLGSYYEVRYDSSMIVNPIVHEFFSLSRSFPVNIVREPGLIRVNFQDQWIFPVSGVVVTWADVGND